MDRLIRDKVAIVTIGDTRVSFYNQRKHIVDAEKDKIMELFSDDFELYMPEPVFSTKGGKDIANTIKEKRIGAVIIHLPIWGTPALAAEIAYSVDLPVLILGNLRSDSSSLVTLLAVAGMLEQEGKKCIRVSGDIVSADIKKQVDDFIKAANLVERVRQSYFGLIGGRSIGIGTTVFDPSQWQKVFGISMDHKDQYEIVYRAENIDEKRINQHLEWIKNGAKIEYEGRFDSESLIRQIRSYLALKDIVSESGFDFLGLKCQTEMSDHYALQCVAVALLNNDVDAEGKKTVIPTSCECDADGALTMRILSLLAGESPSNLVDIKFFEKTKKEFILANCGSMAPYFSKDERSENQWDNTILMQHSFGEAGGASLQMIAKEGNVTIARLFRKNGKYIMGFFEGVLEMRPIEELRKTAWCYPHEFVRADIDYDKFYQTMNSNHLHTVYGNYNNILKNYCEMIGIDYICYNV
ncbi:MAG TPA: hypothetical protein GXX75_21945 [Clostridiales bacterium]|nr:hypothetical protein [Clostridiales bacterium]